MRFTEVCWVDFYYLPFRWGWVAQRKTEVNGKNYCQKFAWLPVVNATILVLFRWLPCNRVRPCEIDEETHREGDFLIARNRKRKNGKIKYKKIPVPKQAQELIEWNKPLTADLHRLKINDMMKDLLAGKTAYCLRHTFATICQQYVRPDIVDIRMGDSPQRLVGKVYTHFPMILWKNKWT